MNTIRLYSFHSYLKSINRLEIAKYMFFFMHSFFSDANKDLMHCYWWCYLSRIVGKRVNSPRHAVPLPSSIPISSAAHFLRYMLIQTSCSISQLCLGVKNANATPRLSSRQGLCDGTNGDVTVMHEGGEVMVRVMYVQGNGDVCWSGVMVMDDRGEVMVRVMDVQGNSDVWCDVMWCDGDGWWRRGYGEDAQKRMVICIDENITVKVMMT